MDHPVDADVLMLPNWNPFHIMSTACPCKDIQVQYSAWFYTSKSCNEVALQATMSTRPLVCDWTYQTVLWSVYPPDGLYVFTGFAYETHCIV